MVLPALVWQIQEKVRITVTESSVSHLAQDLIVLNMSQKVIFGSRGEDVLWRTDSENWKFQWTDLFPAISQKHLRAHPGSILEKPLSGSVGVFPIPNHFEIRLKEWTVLLSNARPWETNRRFPAGLLWKCFRAVCSRGWRCPAGKAPTDRRSLPGRQ